MLTAAPIVRKPLDDIGAPGMTDFVKIYIASELNKSEYRTTLRHEQAHVWAGHNRRRPKDVKNDLWKIACEMEIARTIYDDQDVANISAPRSRLAGAYLADTIKDLPININLAEDIYDWLLIQPQEDIPKNICTCTCGCDFDGTEKTELDDVIDPSEVIASAREKLDADEVSEKSQISAVAAYKAILNRPPSLTEAVDAALRIRVERERSYRRPSRRGEGDIILAGAVSKPRPPLVEIFIDRSGSFSPEKTAQVEIQLNKLLSQYGASIRADVWYFGNGILVSDDPGGGGDTPYHLISQHLEMSMPKIAIIITDDDPINELVIEIKGPVVICIPIGCTSTKLSVALGGKDIR
jgi:hypothetical protein